MKARINYKSKKTIIIIAIAVVLLIAAITGTVAYIKGNNNAAAAMENTEVTEPANNGNDSNNNGGVKNPNTPNTDNPEQIPIIDDNQNPTTPAQNGDTTTNPGTTTNQGTTTGTTTGNAGTTVPDTEYTQTTVVENPWKTEDITWAPISLQAITANNGLEICVPSFSIEKSSEIVKYSENKSDKAEVGDTIKYTITVTNKEFDEVITEDAIDIEGYNKVDPTSAEIKITTGTNEHTFYYTKRDDLEYTIHYKEQGTNAKLAEDKVVTNKKFNEVITENAIDIEGYNKVDPISAEIRITTGTNEHTFYYTKRDDLEYTIHYKEQGTNAKLAEDKVVTNKKFNEVITENAIDIEGYNKVDPISAEIKITTGTNEHTFYYTKRDDLEYTIHYKEQGTNAKLAEDKVVTNKKFNEVITENAIDIEGYNKVDPISAEIRITTGTNEHTFYYTKRTDLTYTVHYYYNGIEAKEELVTVPGQKYLSEVFDVYPKATHNGVKYEEYDRTTSNGTMPLIIGLGTNYIKVYYGTPNVTINKVVDSTTANAGSELNYTITVSEDRGFVNAKNIKVTDNLPSELEVIADSITSDGKLNDAKTEIEWNIAELEKGKDVELKFTAKIKPNTIGKVITNNVTLTDATGNTIGSDSATTTVNGKTVEVREITKGREADDVNIIFIMDNSSSMNEPIANTSYLNDDSYYVAPSDEQKTRLNSAKTATKEFINKIYADKNLKNTNMSVITFNNNESDQEDTADVIGKGPYTSDKVKEESHLFYTKYYVVENNKKIYVEQATDRNYYEIKDTTIKSGANVVGSATSSDYSELVTKVDGITIGCRREGFGTYINPALKQAKTIIEGYKNNEATKANRNIVIVLCDGDINGKYADSLNDLKGDKDKAGLADEIYCIGFGKDAANPKKNAYKTLANMTTVYEKDKSGKLVKKVYTAENTETLIQEFTSILENMNDKKNYITGVSDIVSDIKCGEIAIKASDILEMPLVVYNNDTEVINCASKEELANYGMSYDESNQIIRWDINECIEKNPTIDLSGTLKLRYYIPLN